MVNYPASIDNSLSVPAAVDGSTTVSASIVNRLRDSILAVQTELGIKPSATYTTVKNRLDVLESALSNLIIIELAGDLSGSTSFPEVIGLQGNPISSEDPGVGQALVWTGSAWAPRTISGSGGSFTPSGDLSGSSLSQQVISLTGDAGVVSVPTASLQFGTTSASAGTLRFPSASSAFIRNSDDTADITLFEADANFLSIGTKNNSTKQVSTLALYSGAAFYMGIGGSTKLSLTSGSVMIYTPGDPLVFGYAGAAATGLVRLPAAFSIASRNSGDTDDIHLLDGDGGDSIYIGTDPASTPANQASNTWIGCIADGSVILKTGDGNVGSGYVELSATKFGIQVPLTGSYNSPYSGQGGVSIAFAADADYTVDGGDMTDNGEYVYDWIEFTTGSWTAGHTVIFPAPASKDFGYYKTIYNGTEFVITVAAYTGDAQVGGTRTLADGLAQRFWFDETGVRYASPTTTP